MPANRTRWEISQRWCSGDGDHSIGQKIALATASTAATTCPAESAASRNPPRAKGCQAQLPPPASITEVVEIAGMMDTQQSRGGQAARYATAPASASSPVTSIRLRRRRWLGFSAGTRARGLHQPPTGMERHSSAPLPKHRHNPGKSRRHECVPPRFGQSAQTPKWSMGRPAAVACAG